MFRIISVTILVCIAAFAAAAQSGRRTTPTTAPGPPPVAMPVPADDPGQYSESKPQPPRVRTKPATPKPAPSPVPGAPAEAAQDVTDTEVLRIETNLVTIPVSVFDRNGLYVPGLRQSDFKIFEDGKEQEIAYFGTADKPFTVALVLDVSPSTSYRIEEIRRAAMAFVEQLQPQDRVIVMDFDHSVRVRTPPTQDRQLIFKAINKADFGDGTSLYNAVDEALRKQLGPIEGRKAVVLFTDGVDTTSRKNSYDSTLDFAEESDAMVFPIYFNTYYDNRVPPSMGRFPDIFGGPIRISGVSPEEYARGRRYLEDLASVTGGRVFRPEATPGGLSNAFEGIAEELRRQYNIGYVPNTEGKPGQRKAIKVRVNRANLLIRARDSYIVGSAPTAAPSPSPSPSPSPVKQ